MRRSDTGVVVLAIAVSRVSVLQDCEISVAFGHWSELLSTCLEVERPRLTLLDAFSCLVYVVFVVPRLRSDRLEG